MRCNMVLLAVGYDLIRIAESEKIPLVAEVFFDLRILLVDFLIVVCSYMKTKLYQWGELVEVKGINTISV